MIIDVHCHIWSFEQVGYYKDKPLFSYMEDNKIRQVSLIAMNNRENIEATDLVKKYPDKLFGIAYVDPLNAYESLNNLKEGVKKGYFKGVKMYPFFEHFRLDDRKLYPIYEACLTLDIPLLFHMGWININHDQSSGHKGKYACTGFPVQFGNILEDFPRLKLIMAHLGGNYYYECLNMAERFENVFLETAWLQYYSNRFFPKHEIHQWIEHAYSILGSKKIIFGGEGVFPSDIQNLNLPDEHKLDILGGNAAKVFKLVH